MRLMIRSFSYESYSCYQLVLRNILTTQISRAVNDNKIILKYDLPWLLPMFKTVFSSGSPTSELVCVGEQKQK